MPESARRTLVTAALPYANGPLHLGHLAGCYLPADIYVRYLRQQGQPVLFVCGSDEHGAAITMKARKAGKSPGEVVDEYDALMRQAFEQFGIAFDIYSRTSDRPRSGEADDVRAGLHRATAQEFFTRFIQTGDLEPRQTEQLYDPEAQVFLADRYVTGTCPVCSYPRAYGDQCENCGSTLAPDQLIDPRSTLSGATPVKRATTHWFLRLDKWSDTIRQYIDAHDEWRANVLGQCRSWLNAKDGLQPRAMTRDLDWGIDVPVVTDAKGNVLVSADDAAGKKLYVWFDAPIGYISATKEWAMRQGTPDAWKDWWLLDTSLPEHEREQKSTRLVHFIGKDNIVFHCILFPEMLHRHGAYVRADAVPANEFLNLEGEKLSTSRGWAVWLHEYLADPDLGPRTDELRYYLTAIAPETSDSNFSWKDFQTRINSELVATFSNYVHRVMTLVWKYYEGKPVDELTKKAVEKNDWYQFRISRPENREGYEIYTEGVFYNYNLAIKSFQLKAGMEIIMSYVRSWNVMLSETKPWKTVEEHPELTRITLCHAINSILYMWKLITPYLPEASVKLARCLNIDPKLPPEEIGVNHQLGQPEMLFTPIPDEVIARQVAKLDAVRAAQSAAATPPTVGGVAERRPAGEADPTRAAGATYPKAGEVNLPPPKAEIAFADFERLDLRLGTVTAASAVPKADKLLHLTVSLGALDPAGTRSIVSGIAQHYRPEQLVGQRVLVVANLAPRTMRGVESRGMVLLAEGPDGRLVLVQPPPGAEGLPDGSVVR